MIWQVVKWLPDESLRNVNSEGSDEAAKCEMLVAYKVVLSFPKVVWLPFWFERLWLCL